VDFPYRCALKIASRLFLLFSPRIARGNDAKTSLPGYSAVPRSWAAVSTGRIIGLTILNHIGVHLWDGLSVLAFPVPENTDSATRTYSWRLQRNFGADDDYLADIHRAVRPVQVLVGGSDELRDAERLKAEFQSQRSDIPVTIIPGLGHSDMVIRPDAIRALVAAFN
jgi:non-heme chloroperoxidase